MREREGGREGDGRWEHPFSRDIIRPKPLFSPSYTRSFLSTTSATSELISSGAVVLLSAEFALLAIRRVSPPEGREGGREDLVDLFGGPICAMENVDRG